MWNYIQPPIYIGVWSKSQTMYFTHIQLAELFSRAEGVPKPIENPWKFVMFIVIHRRSPFHHAHTIDT